MASKTLVAMENLIFKDDAASLLSREIDVGNLLGFNNVISITLGMNIGLAHYVNREITCIDLGKVKFLNGYADDYFSIGWVIERWKQLTDIDLSSL